jgi:hypothetical protein
MTQQGDTDIIVSPFQIELKEFHPPPKCQQIAGYPQSLML